jgi:hypothetical protein
MRNRRIQVRVRYRENELFMSRAGRPSEIANASSPNDRLMFRRILAWSASNPSIALLTKVVSTFLLSVSSYALLTQLVSTFLLSVSSSWRKDGFRNVFCEEEQDR